MNGCRYYLQQIMISLAGSIAEEICAEGDEHGWRRSYSKEWVTCYHEGGHAAIRHLLHKHVAELKVVPGVGGYCAPKVPEEPFDIRANPSDAEKIAKYCNILEVSGYKCPIEAIRTGIKRLLRRHWSLVRRFAIELHDALEISGSVQNGGMLNEEQISKILGIASPVDSMVEQAEASARTQEPS